MATIKSGVSSDVLTIGTTSKAARVELYDSRGNNRGVKRTYRAATTAPFVAAAGTGLFFVIEGSGTATIRIQRIRISGLTLTAVAYSAVVLQKYSTASSGGTPTNLTIVNVDSTDAAGTANRCAVFTAAPTAGSAVGAIASMRPLAQATTAAAAGIPDVDITFDFRVVGEADCPTLRGTAQGLGLNFAASPASAVTMTLEVEWTEE